MNTLTKSASLLNYQDENYKHAVNYSGSLHNYPICLNYGEKHNKVKYILPSGTQDHLTLLQDGVFIYVIGENNSLSYISLMVINTELKQVEGEVFLSGNDIDTEDSFSYGILDMESAQQLKILFEYL